MLAALNVPIHALVFLAGAGLSVRAVLSAIRTFVLPRASGDGVAKVVFINTRRVFRLFAGPDKPYRQRDRLMAYFGPISLIVLPTVWLVMIITGYTLMYWAIGVETFQEAFLTSGSSMLTLGFHRPENLPVAEPLMFTEAAIGLGLVALLISYLPAIYAGFSRRELLVSQLEVRADSPPSAVVLITRFHRLSGLERLHDTWERWEQWFAELEESHTSLTVLVDYRSQQADLSWVNAAGAMMDAAALVRSSVAVPLDAQADLMIRAGYLALRRIGRVFGIRFNPNPQPSDVTSVSRAMYDEAYDVLAAAGVPMVPDRDQAWRDFNGWRVNYDEVLRGLERLTVAPPGWWELPKRSAWYTDEPSREVAALHGAHASAPVASPVQPHAVQGLAAEGLAADGPAGTEASARAAGA